jgi:Ca-activated chloride channel family protein
MRFQHPDYFVFLVGIPVLLFVLWMWQQWRHHAVSALGHPAQMRVLLSPYDAKRFWAAQMLFVAGIALLVLALANPVATDAKQQQQIESSDVIIVLDISNSMLAEDVKPNRLELARRFATQLIRSLDGERMGLILFAGNAFLQVPLSTDYGFLLQSLQTASPDLLTTQGTAIAAAVRLSQKTFDSEMDAGRALILITDGEDHDKEAVESVEKALSDYGIVTFAVGAGTAEGGPVPTEGGGYKRDDSGEMVRTRLNESLLREIALAGTTGTVYNLRRSEQAAEEISKAIRGLAKRQITVPVAALLETRYQWLLGAAILFLLLSYTLWKGHRRVA